MRALSLALLALLCLASPLLSEESENTAEAAAKRYLTAIQQGGIPRMADFIHPEEISRFKTMMLPIYRAEAQAGGSELLAATFGPRATIAEVEAAKPDEVVRRVLDVHAAQAASLGAVGIDQAEVLGSVKEREGLVHVVARTHFGSSGLNITQIQIISLLSYKGSWKTVLPVELEGWARAMGAAP